VLISAPPPVFEPSPELRSAWDAEESALERGDVDAAVEAVVNAWTFPDASPELRDRVAVMQRRAFVLQAEAAALTEAFDPVEQQPDSLSQLNFPTLVAVGEHDFSDFRNAAQVMARTLPRARHAVIAGAGHLAPLETPEVFASSSLSSQ
jgi:pimeloyl-ACP methyl ester carboxylesterase